MPFNLFNKSSKSTISQSPDSSPSPTTINHVATHLLRLAYPSKFSHLLPLDTNQFLTEVYGSDPSSTYHHWDWIGCTFPPELVKRALDTLNKAASPLALPSSYRRKLYGLAKRIWNDQQGLQKKIYRDQGAEVGDGFRRTGEERKSFEVGKVERIIKARVGGIGGKAYGAAAA
ncbi:MAG: hypothetical protein Q9167_005574, partial [Letrouitia subvulpina]